MENFTVSNEYGSVQFIGETDLTFVDLADVITISLGVCDVYEGEKHEKTKPAVGEKLNRPALITLYNMKPINNQTPIEKERRLKSLLEKADGAQHLSYDMNSF